MKPVRIETVVQPNGRVVIEGLPFDEGDTVEVIVSEGKNGKKSANRYPLRGTPFKYDDPFSPVVPLEDWDVLK